MHISSRFKITMSRDAVEKPSERTHPRSRPRHENSRGAQSQKERPTLRESRGVVCVASSEATDPGGRRAAYLRGAAADISTRRSAAKQEVPAGALSLPVA